jgi:nicotinamidase/pyrazinamidase
VSASRSRVVLWDVDTQVDFMEPTGRLYVPGAHDVREAMGRLVRAARAAGVVHVASADDHLASDAEISEAPDFVVTYPPHCMRGTHGAEKIAETAQRDPVVLEPTTIPTLTPCGEYLLLKQSTDVFTNPNAAPLLDFLQPSEVIVFGVATDVCDHAAIVGMLDRGWKVTFVDDAARGLSGERTAACIAEWRARGVRVTTTDEVVDAFARG